MHVLKPEYVFRPLQGFRRLAYLVGLTVNNQSAETPWGLPITFDPTELHGRAMLTLGLSDLRTCEMISRIVRPGDRAVDIGANIGIMTSLMARRAEESGAIYAFEPHPHTRGRLEHNVREWNGSCLNCASVEVLPYAVSSRVGMGHLVEPASFGTNSGVARLVEAGAQGQQTHRVDTIIFDEWSAKMPPTKLVKIDVEGHEDDVLAGMKKSLAAGRIDFLIIEEMRQLPSPACEFLQQFGYKTFLIDRTFFGPQLLPTENCPSLLTGEATNLLAVAEGLSIEFLQRNGWTCLHSN